MPILVDWWGHGDYVEYSSKARRVQYPVAAGCGWLGSITYQVCAAVVPSIVGLGAGKDVLREF